MEIAQSLAARARRFEVNEHRVRPEAAPDARQRFSVTWADTEADLQEAQSLRYKVFAEEMGARLPGPPGLDVDEFDAYCDHLLVRDTRTREVIGTYRLLPPSGARRMGRLYSDSEFDLTRLADLRSRTLELGRSCVHRDYRGGAVVMLLWSGLADYMTRNNCDTLLGCASVTVADGGHYAADLYNVLRSAGALESDEHAVPRLPLPVAQLATGSTPPIPPLLKGYLRVGAKVCGAPAWDPDFKTADFLTILRGDAIKERYVRHFLEKTLQPA